MSFYASQCFPARSLLRFKKNTDGGAWLAAYKENQRKRFAAALYPIENDGKRGLTHGQKKPRKGDKSISSVKEDDYTVLDGMYLLNEMNVEDPSDLAYVNLFGKNLTSGVTEDFVLFDNVIHIEAGENNLAIETFKTFPALRELELQLNGVSSLPLSQLDFKYLEFLDLSFNSVPASEILHLGTLTSLRCLHLTGNGLEALPSEMIQSYRHATGTNKSETKRWFQSLEILYLDDNDFADISVFASLASLPQLKMLSLSKNKLTYVPQFRLLTYNKTHVLPKADFVAEEGGFESQTVMLAESLERPEINAIGQETLAVDGGAIEYASRIENSQSEFIEANENLNVHMPETGNEVHQISKTFSNEEVPNADVNDSDWFFPPLNDKDADVSKAIGEIPGVNFHLSSYGDSTDLDLASEGLENAFQSLEKLDLTFNMITEDEALLPLAMWPSLREVNVWENPLVKSRRGLSPFLRYHLTELCGIKMNRMIPRKSCKPAVGPAITPLAIYNKVHDRLPPVRRKNMLLLEFENYEAAVKNGLSGGQPLPPINHADENSEQRKCCSAPVRKTDRDGERHTRPYSAATYPFGNIQMNTDSGNKVLDDTNDSNASHSGDLSGVFLTQVDLSEDSAANPVHDEEAVSTEHDENIKVSNNTISLATGLDPIDELLKTDDLIDCNDLPPEGDVNANINALKFALDNLLVFNESSLNSTEQNRFTQNRHDHKTIHAHRTRQEKIMTALDGMREQSNFVEENLGVVLEKYDTDPELKRQFPNVKRLLKEVQSKYDKVRLTSIQSANSAQKLIDSTSKKSGDNQSVAHKKSQSRISNKNASCMKETRSLDAIQELKKFKEVVGSRI